MSAHLDESHQADSSTSSAAIPQRRTDERHSLERASLLRDRERQDGTPRVSSASEEDDDFELDNLTTADIERNLVKNKSQEDGTRNSIETVLDEAAVVEDYDISMERLGNRVFWRKFIINGFLIGMWYLFSVCISVYNKWMFGQTAPDAPDDKINFPFPLFSTSIHMLVQFILSSLVLVVFPRFRPRRTFKDGTTGEGETADQAISEDGKRKPLMTSKFYLTRIAPCGAATGLDIGLGNTSLKFVTLTFFTMCKSSTLGFVLAFAIIFRLEKPSWKIAGIIAVMTAGVIMMVAGETAFSLIGFLLLMSAAFFSGLRWSLVQILLRRNPATSNPFASLFFLTPMMFVTLLLISLPVENPSKISAGFDALTHGKGAFLGVLILLFPGVLAFLMTAAEFALLQRTSVVTLSVCGIFKEVITISTASAVFGDDLTPINISGLITTVVAIGIYNYIRVVKMRQKAMAKVQRKTEEEAPMLNGAVASERASATPAPLETNGIQTRSFSPPSTTSMANGKATRQRSVGDVD